MTDETILTFKKLKEQWAILKDEKSPKVDKRSAAKEIIKLQEELEKFKVSGFEPIDLNMTKYAEFVPMNYKHTGKVLWGEVSTDDIKHLGDSIQNAVDLVQTCEALAVQITRELIPTEALDSQKFGMIVSAKCEKLVNAYYNERKLKLYIKGK